MGILIGVYTYYLFICRFDEDKMQKGLSVVVVILWYSDLQESVQSVPKVVSSNRAHGEVYSIQHYATPVPRFPPPIKLTTTI